MTDSNVVSIEATKLPADRAKTLVTVAGLVAAVGVVLCVVAGLVDPARFAFSYLTGFAYTFTLMLGAFFFVIIVHATKAGWSVVARRHMEWVAGNMWVLIPLFIPIALMASHIYFEWWHPEPDDTILAQKAGWLNPTFFFIRAAFYLIVWAIIGWWFAKTSRAQDDSGDPQLTVRMANVSYPMMRELFPDHPFRVVELAVAPAGDRRQPTDAAPTAARAERVSTGA